MIARALRLAPTSLCLSSTCFADVLQQPLVERVPVADLIGVEYAYDVALTQGFYVLVASYFVTRSVLFHLARWYKERTDDDAAE